MFEKKLHWSDQLEILLGQEGEKCLSYNWLHREAQKKYDFQNQILTIPSIILGTVNGSISVGSSAVFGTWSGASVIIGFVGILTAILNTLNSFFNNAKRAESHRISALSYEKINRLIMIELALCRNERLPPDQLINIIKSDFDKLNDIAPIIPDDLIIKYKSQFKDSDISKPSICNGLDRILINKIISLETPKENIIIKIKE